MGSTRHGLPRLSLLLGALAVLALTAASANGVRRVGVHLMVGHVTRRPGPVDPAVVALHRRLLHEFHYRSLRVLVSRRLSLRIDQVGSVRLPTGDWVRVSPLDLGTQSVLIAVNIQGTLQTRLRVANHHQVVIGAEPYRDGKLIVTLEPDF